MNLEENRRIRYIDRSIQKWMLIGLIAMEVTLAIASIAVLYFALADIIDENLYRIHQSNDESILPLLLKECARVVGIMFLVNLIALFVADRIWAAYVRRVTGNLSRLMLLSKSLDWRETDLGYSGHAVLVKAQAWRFAEQFRCEDLRDKVAVIPETLPPLEERAVMREKLAEIQGLLP